VKFHCRAFANSRRLQIELEYFEAVARGWLDASQRTSYDHHGH
jgi:hypothetical protein